jgi:hypothetical protein
VPPVGFVGESDVAYGEAAEPLCSVEKLPQVGLVLLWIVYVYGAVQTPLHDHESVSCSVLPLSIVPGRAVRLTLRDADGALTTTGTTFVHVLAPVASSIHAQ